MAKKKPERRGSSGLLTEVPSETSGLLHHRKNSRPKGRTPCRRGLNANNANRERELWGEDATQWGHRGEPASPRLPDWAGFHRRGAKKTTRRLPREPRIPREASLSFRCVRILRVRKTVHPNYRPGIPDITHPFGAPHASDGWQANPPKKACCAAPSE